MSAAATVIILGEDRAHINSVRRALTDHLGIPADKVRTLPAPAGQGDATKYVLDRVKDQVNALCSRPASVRLIICLDADKKTTHERRREIDDRLTGVDLDSQRRTTSIVYIVPRRNIETWRHFGRGAKADETTDYKRGDRSAWGSADYKLIGQLLGRKEKSKNDQPPSLSESKSELLAKFRPT